MRSRRRHRSHFCGTLALSLVLGSVAAAQDRPIVELSWTRARGADACASRTDLAAAVSDRLGYDPFAGAPTQWIEGTIAVDGDRFTAELWDRDAQGSLLGSRTLRSASSDCRSLDAALVLAIALAIDPEAALTSEPAPTPPEPPAPAPATACPICPAPIAAPPPERAPAVSLSFLTAMDLVPGFAPGVSLRIDAPIADVIRWNVGALMLPDQRTAEHSGAVFGFGLAAAYGGVGIVSPAAGPFVFAFDLAVALGTLTAVVYGPTPTAPGGRIWGAAMLRALASAAIYGPLFISVAAGAVVPFLRDAFVVEGRPSPEFQEPPIAAFFEASVGMHFL